MKRIVSLLAVLLLLGSLLIPSVSAADKLSVSASATSVTVGKTVTVTLKYNGGGAGIGGLIGSLKYDTAVFSYVSFTGTNGMDASGNAGVVRFVYAASGATAPTDVSITVTLKAIAAGNDTIAVSTEEFINDKDYSSLGSPSKSISISASNPSLSGDATLKTLRPTKGTLVPKFDKNVTEYTVSVPYTVTRGLLVFEPTDPGAKSVVTENADLKVGKTTRVITVTAPNGTTKKYTVVFTREAQQSTTGNSTASTTLPVIESPEVEVGGEMFTVSVTQPPIAPPPGFTWDFITLGDNEVSAAKQNNGDMTLLYLLNKATNAGQLYIYDATEDSFSPFRQLTGTFSTYVLHDLPEIETAPAGTVVDTITIGENTVTAYVYEDPALADYAILFLTSPTGVDGYYTYDKLDGSIQRHHAVTIEQEPVIVEPEPQVETNPVIAFVQMYKEVILVGAAACAGLAILIVVIVWIASHSGGGKGKH